LHPSNLLTVSLQVLASAVRPVKHRATVRLHLGTAEVLATLSLLTTDQLAPGQDGLAQLFLREPVASIWDQPFVIRSESPVLTIGGGRVLVPDATKIKQPGELDLTKLQSLSANRSEPERVAAAIYFVGFNLWGYDDLPRLAGARQAADTVASLQDTGELVALEVSPRRTAIVQKDFLAAWYDRIARALSKLHADNPMRSAIDAAKLASQFSYVDDAALLGAVIKQMAAAGLVRLTTRGVASSDHKLKLSKPQQELLNQIIQRYASAQFEPPMVAEYQAELPKRADDIEKLVQVAVAEEQLVHITKDFYLHTDVEANLRTTVSDALTDNNGLTMSEIRELLATTRKYAVPLCEYLDRIGLTKRNGDVRVLV
jgi:selenocysteine-specific elongation factor